MTEDGTFIAPGKLCAILALLLGGCSTAAAPGSQAPPEAARMQALSAADAPAIDACWRAVLASPPHRALRARTGDHADSPSAEQRASRDRASPSEVAWLADLQRDHVEPCRRLALASAARAHPTIAAILRDSYGRADANAARLAAGQITWGEYVSENQAIVTHRRAELLAAGETLQREAAGGAPPPR